MRAFLCFLFCVFPLVAYGQITPITGALTGRVYNDFGHVITEATIKIRGADNKDRLLRTNDVGAFEINLTGGNYLIEVRALGFHAFRAKSFRVVSNGTQNLDIVLEVERGGHGFQVPVKKKKRN